MNCVIDGYNINYEWIGEGDETVVMLQGWGTTYGIYNSIAQTLSPKCRVLLFNLPGFGESDEPREAWAVSDYADFFVKFMKELDVKEATLMGHSYGGRVIIKLANRDNLPFSIKRIVLIDSAGILPKKSFKQKYKIRKYKILKKVVEWSIAYKICPELIDEWKSHQGSADYRNATPIMRQCLVKTVNEDLTELLPNIKQEVLLIWGENDTATPLSDGKKMDELIPDSGLAVIKNAGHFCFVEQPAIFTSIIKSYFAI